MMLSRHLPTMYKWGLYLPVRFNTITLLYQEADSSDYPNVTEYIHNVLRGLNNDA